MWTLVKTFGVLVALAVLITACERDIDVTPPVALAPAPPAAEQFAAVQSSSSGESRVFGTYTRGCIAGAQQLPLEALQWQVLNPARNRAWGHPGLIRFIRVLAAGVASDGFRGVLVGDLAQPRGGPLPSDHNSHQVGLDADIWLTPLPVRKLSAGQLETFEPPSMVDVSTLRVNALFGAAQVSLLKRAAQAPGVERIFVSPPIKQALCDRAEGQAWLQKIRPWRGHMAHMHVRMACPVDSDDCTDQEPPPEGDGCGAELRSWFTDTSWTREGSTKYVPEKAMRLDGLPAQCRQLLRG